MVIEKAAKVEIIAITATAAAADARPKLYRTFMTSLLSIITLLGLDLDFSILGLKFMAWNMATVHITIRLSGLYEVEPKTCPGFIYRCSIPMGRVNMPLSEFRTFIGSVASEYHGDTYHLISKNCNHFTDDIAWRLTGKRIPGWVNRLARLGAFCSCLLPESLQVTTVKQLPEYHNYTEDDGSDSSSTATPWDSTESDREQDKHLLSPASGSSDVAFIKETPR